jgi:molecular chaperone DnaJ
MVSTSSNDFYEILGVSKNASEQEIKSAYKKAARKFHPDNSETGDEDLFKKVGEAYDVLKDPNKKAIYDQYGEEGLKGAGGFGGAGGFSGFSDFAGAGGFEDLGDIFSSFFGGGFSSAGRSSGPRASRGQDHSVEISLKFLDPLADIKKKVKLNPLVECNSCDGSGAKSKSDIVECATCHGHGQVTTVQNTILGQIRQSSTCPSCKGSGKTIKNTCSTCRGKGQRREEKEVEITIPAGIYDGATMRLAGMGDAGKHGGRTGDIYLYINVAEDKNFKREAENIFTEIDIGFADASLGTELEIAGLEGKENLKIKAGIQSGEIFTLKSKGFPVLNNARRRGDYYVKVNVLTPQNLSSREKQLLKELKELRKDKDTSL